MRLHVLFMRLNMTVTDKLSNPYIFLDFGRNFISCYNLCINFAYHGDRKYINGDHEFKKKSFHRKQGDKSTKRQEHTETDSFSTA